MERQLFSVSSGVEPFDRLSRSRRYAILRYGAGQGACRLERVLASMTAEDEPGFSFVDKRRVTADAEPASSDSEPAEAEQSATPPLTDTEDASTPQELPTLTVRDRLLMCIDILHQGAWISMGLVADPSTGQMARDLEDARIAIDSVAFLAGKLEGEVDEATMREVRRLVSDLQVNFVRQKQQG